MMLYTLAAATCLFLGTPFQEQVNHPGFLLGWLIDLLSQMLQKDPQKRITVQKIQYHECVQDMPWGCARPIGEDVCPGLMSQSAMSSTPRSRSERGSYIPVCALGVLAGALRTGGKEASSSTREKT
jgi:serine/threonine protein kinase